MDLEELRARQAPIKDAYRADPPSALRVLHASGVLDAGAITCRVETHLGVVEAGLHPAAGGDPHWACSGDLLLQSLVACAGVTLGAVAKSMGVAIRGGRVLAEGDLDFRGTLGVSKETPVGFTAIRVRFEVDSDADRDQLEKLVRLAERYCVIYQTLARPPALETSLEIIRNK